MPDGERPASLHIHDGRIAAIRPHDDWPANVRRIDAGELTILPGLVDSHVHINEPGRTEWEGFDSGTRAAAAGGVTTIVDMPLNSVPATTTAEGLAAKRAAAQGRCFVDVGFWGGLVPGNVGDLAALARAGVRGFKCFLTPSGVDEFPNVTEADLDRAGSVLHRLGLPLLAHAELPAELKEPVGHPTHYRTWLMSRPPQSEVAAIELLVKFSSTYRVAVHVVHLATAAALPALVAARSAGTAITVETCPHYLTFAAEAIADGATAFKCAPPIRSGEERSALWRALLDGHVDLIATDHSPAPASLKEVDSGDFARAWGGIASLQLGLAAVWTGASARHIGIDRVSTWMSTAPATLGGFADRKGSIAEGHDADLVVFDPDATTRVDPTSLFHRHPVTPYAGMTLRGQVKMTMLRGEIIFDADKGFTCPPMGRFI